MPEKQIMDGNTAAAYVSYAFTDVAGIFPITPSSPMAELVDAWAANGKQNIFGRPVDVVEMQSEGGAAGTMHGSLQAGALTTTYTASQGLLLMIPNMYKMAGEFLPGVFHVSARTVSAHALSIFGDHSDVMSCRMTGFAMLAASSPQEVMDMAAVAHLSAIAARHPFLHYFDGFRTSHELQKIDVLDYADLRKLVDFDALAAFRKNALNPEHPVTRGTTVNPDIFFQCREGSNEHFDAIPAIVERSMQQINALTGRNYSLFDYYGDPEAESVIVAMCSVAETIKETVDWLRASGKKVGLVTVHLYRPFSARHFFWALPKTVKRIAVLDRTKEPGATGEPLYHDVCTACREEQRDVFIVGGRYGLSSKDTTPAQIVAVYDNLDAAAPINHFTVGIEDDVTFTSLPLPAEPALSPAGQISCKIWGLGADGTVGANKNSIKIIGDATGMHTQAYFVYDSKKSGGLTQSHLRFGDSAIRSPYLVTDADFVACHNPAYVGRYDLVRDLKQGGIFLLNCGWTAGELENKLPAAMRRALALKDAHLYTIDAIAIARELGLGGRINTVLQAAFFKLTGVIDLDLAVSAMKKAAHDTYFLKRGKEVVDMNNAAIDRGLDGMVRVPIPESWRHAVSETAVDDLPDFVRDIVEPMNRQSGDSLPVSIFKKYNLLDGTWPAGTTRYEKRGTAVEVPQWNSGTCIQCNRCAFVCPHAAIRPVLLDKSEVAAAPSGFATVKAIGKDCASYTYRMQVSPYDCTGCGSCVAVCPAKEKALTLRPLDTQVGEAGNWTFAVETVTVKQDVAGDATVKSSQFRKPYFEFSGACAGCGETPYIKLATQLFGDRMYIANASGCSSAYGGSTPSTPYCTDARGHGPAWAMSLFEDNAEYAYGFLLGQDAIRKQLAEAVESLARAGVAKAACEKYLAGMHSSAATTARADELVAALRTVSSVNLNERAAVGFVLENAEFLTKKSVWAFGGDGWAYDIGYGGLDHVLASGRDINMLVLDTEVYSNTGGQSSKATAAGAVAKFAAGGKTVKKKDLGMMAISYGYIYVAQVAMGYDQAQTLRALREAEAYPGPSLVIAYSPCIEHGITIGMGRSQEEMKRAVEAGYWHLYRYNPLLKAEGKNPFVLDSPAPSADLRQFLRGEGRYATLELSFPERAGELFDKAARDADERLQSYRNLAQGGADVTA